LAPKESKAVPPLPATSGTTRALLAPAIETRWGGTVGAGLEFRFAQNWSVVVDYDNLFTGSRNIALTAPFFSETEHIKQAVDIGLVRLNYGFGASVAARY
jgi:outer membrane immunogenic protein